MKVKEIERTANMAWSPAQQYPVYMACGTAAQQLDATFSTQSTLEIFKFNPGEVGPDCELVASVDTDHRFNKVRALAYPPRHDYFGRARIWYINVCMLLCYLLM